MPVFAIVTLEWILRVKGAVLTFVPTGRYEIWAQTIRVQRMPAPGEQEQLGCTRYLRLESASGSAYAIIGVRNRF